MTYKNKSYALNTYSDTSEGLIFLNDLKKRVNKFKSTGLGDSNFEEQLYGDRREDFFSRLWELRLAEKLQESGLDIRSSPSGPDFTTSIQNRTIWFEAISPTPSGFQDDIDYDTSKAYSIRCNEVPHKKILLRITSAIKDKMEKYEKYIAKGIVGTHDINIIAVDTTQLGLHGYIGISQNPSILEAVYPIGPFFVSINKDNMRITDRGTSYRSEIEKESQSKTIQIPTDSFLSNNYKNISAVIGAWSSFKGSACTIVHNINAANQLPCRLLNTEKEFVAEIKRDILTLTDINNTRNESFT